MPRVRVYTNEVDLTHRRTPVHRRGGGFIFGGPRTIPGLVAWYKADSIAQADGSTVASWADSSGNGNTLVQAVEIDKPVFQTNEANGKPVVRFGIEGTQFMVKDAAALGGIPGADKPMSVVVAFRRTGGAGDQQTIMSLTDAGGNPPVIYMPYLAVTTNTIGALKNDDAGVTVAAGAGADPTSFVVYSIVDAGVTCSTWRNGVADAVDTAYNNGACTVTHITVGGLINGSTVLVGDLAEIMLFDQALSTVNRKHLENYLAAEYDISIV